MTQLNIKSLNKESIILYQRFLEKIFKNFDLKYNVFNLPTTKKRITLLKSPHVNKSAREQFELKSYKCTFFFRNKITKQSTLYKYILLNKPKTVQMIIKIK